MSDYINSYSAIHYIETLQNKLSCMSTLFTVIFKPNQRFLAGFMSVLENLTGSTQTNRLLLQLCPAGNINLALSNFPSTWAGSSSLLRKNVQHVATAKITLHCGDNAPLFTGLRKEFHLKP